MNTLCPVVSLALAVAFVLCPGSFSLSAETKAGGYTGPAPAARSSGGGYSGPGLAVISTEQARNMRDDVGVTLQGYIVQSLGGDKYLFRDASGTIHVDIDHDKWNGQTVGPEDKVELRGEVDKDWNSVEIDVKQILKQ